MPWHIKGAFDNATLEVVNELTRRLVARDDSLAESCAIALGEGEMCNKSAFFEAQGETLNAALTLWALSLTGAHGHLTREREAELLNNALNLICDGAHSSTFDEYSDAMDLELKMRERLLLIDRAGRAKQLARVEELLAEARQKKENLGNFQVRKAFGMDFNSLTSSGCVLSASRSLGDM